MRRRMAWAIPWLLAVALPVLLTQGSTAQGDNLLINGGFENGTAAWLADGGELTVDDALVHGGSSAGVFAAAGAEDEVSQCLAVAPSTDYEFRGYAARRQDDTLSSLTIHWKDRDGCLGQELWTVQSPLVALDDQEHWHELALGARSPSAARSAYFSVVVRDGGVSIYLDDFAVKELAAPTETPTPEPSASPMPTATAQPPIPSASPTPHVSPTASSWQWTPGPVDGGLRNGSFEEADSEGLPSYWRKYGGELARISDVYLEGQFSAAFSSQTSSTKWVYQTAKVHGGRAYVLSASALKDDPAVAAAYLRISWYASPDGSGQAIESADSTERLTDDSPQFRFLTTGAVVAPDGAASAKARLMLDPTGEMRGTVYFDAVVLEETTLPEPTASPAAKATPRLVHDRPTSAPPSPTPTGSAPSPTRERRAAPTPTDGATTPRPSPTGTGGGGNRATASLGAARTPVASATAATTVAARAPAAVYRQRKSEPPVADGATEREESVGGGLSPQLLALAAGVPALAGAGAGVYYWRWRRARLR